MGDPFVICPFNKSHKILMSRLQGHLLKCMKSNSPTGPTLCPFDSNHIIDVSQIVQHCIMCPSIKNVLMQSNTHENMYNSVNNTTSTSTSACTPTAKVINDDIEHLNTKKNIKTSHEISPRRLEYKMPKTFSMLPAAQEIEKSENKNPQYHSENNFASEKYHTIASGFDSAKTNPFFPIEVEPPAINNIDFVEIYQKLEALEEKEVIIGKEMHNLRQKEQKISDEKRELVETLKSIIVYMNINTNYRTNNNTQEHQKVDSYHGEADLNTGNNIETSDKQDNCTSSSEVEKKPSYYQDVGSPMMSSTSSSSTLRSSPSAKKTEVFGRGIMRVYNQRKMFSNTTDLSQGLCNTKGPNHRSAV